MRTSQQHRLKMPIHGFCETDNLNVNSCNDETHSVLLLSSSLLMKKVLDYLRAVKIYGLISFNWYGNNELLHAIPFSVSSDNYRFFGNQFFAHKISNKEKLKLYNSTLFGPREKIWGRGGRGLRKGQNATRNPKNEDKVHWSHETADEFCRVYGTNKCSEST